MRKYSGRFTLLCPSCETGILPYVNAKMNSDKSVRIWRRICPDCEVEVVDIAHFTREIIPVKKRMKRFS